MYLVRTVNQKCQIGEYAKIISLKNELRIIYFQATKKHAEISVLFLLYNVYPIKNNLHFEIQFLSGCKVADDHHVFADHCAELRSAFHYKLLILSHLEHVAGTEKNHQRVLSRVELHAEERF